MTSRKSKRNAGNFLPKTTTPKQQPSPRRPFIDDPEINSKVLTRRGMAAAVDKAENGKGLFVNFDIDDHLQDIKVGERGKFADLLTSAVRAAVEAAIPAIITAVKNVCLSAVKEEVNPHLLRLQYKQDELAQQLRRDNLRIAGVKEEEETNEESEQSEKKEEKEESEEMLQSKVIQCAAKVGVTIKKEDLSTCYRVGRKSEGKVRQILVRLVSRSKRDAIHAGRFKLKGDSSMDGVYINEDITPMRFAVLKTAKASPLVKRVSTRNGNIVCKLTDDTYKTIASPDDLFDVGLDTINYQNFKLHYME